MSCRSPPGIDAAHACGRSAVHTITKPDSPTQRMWRGADAFYSLRETCFNYHAKNTAQHP
jgi:hypothetical protein